MRKKDLSVTAHLEKDDLVVEFVAPQEKGVLRVELLIESDSGQKTPVILEIPTTESRGNLRYGWSEPVKHVEMRSFAWGNYNEISDIIDKLINHKFDPKEWYDNGLIHIGETTYT